MSVKKSIKLTLSVVKQWLPYIQRVQEHALRKIDVKTKL